MVVIGSNDISSSAAQVIITLFPIVAITLCALIIFFYILWKHHETKLQIKLGTFQPSKFNLAAFSLLTGLLLTGIGLALTAVFAIINGFSYSLLAGLIPMMIGICFLIFFKINPDFHKKD